MKITTLILTLFLFATSTCFGQEYQVPTNYKLEQESDYAQYEENVLECINYLESTPIGNSATRKNAMKFLMEWTLGTPSITIELGQNIVTFMDNADLFGAFMGGWTKFVLENQEAKNDLVKCNYAGLLSVIKVYNLNLGKKIKRTKEIEKLVGLEKKGKLKEWVATQLNTK